MPAPISAQWRSADPPDVLVERLRSLTRSVDGGFTLMHRLSGAGVVVRTLRAPATDRPLFGTIDGMRFAVALVPSPQDVTPYHPIVRGEIRAGDTGGTLIAATIAHHPDARSFAPVFALGGVLLGASVVFALPEQPVVIAGGCMLALGFFVYPALHANRRFQGAAATTADTFRRLLAVDQP